MCAAHYAQKWRGSAFSVAETLDVPLITCSAIVDGVKCTRKHAAKGLCRYHAQQRREEKNLTAIKNVLPLSFRNTLGEKQCRSCLAWKETRLFNNKLEHSDGLDRFCIECSKTESRKFRSKGCSVVIDGIRCSLLRASHGMCGGHRDMVVKGVPLTLICLVRRPRDASLARNRKGEKECIHCGQWKDEECFYHTPSTSDNLQSSCKDCVKSISAKNYKRRQNVGKKG